MGLKKLNEIDNATDEIKATDEIIGVFGGKLAKAKVNELTNGNSGTTDYTNLDNIPIIKISSSEFITEELKPQSIYLTDTEVRFISSEHNTKSSIPKGTLIITGEQKTDNEGLIIWSYGATYIYQLNRESDWMTSDNYFVCYSEVDALLNDLSDYNIKYKDKKTDKSSVTIKLGDFLDRVWWKLSGKQDTLTIGDGLKLENGVLSLDIENGDNLTYGTQAVEVNEVTDNE